MASSLTIFGMVSFILERWYWMLILIFISILIFALLIFLCFICGILRMVLISQFLFYLHLFFAICFPFLYSHSINLCAQKKVSILINFIASLYNSSIKNVLYFSSFFSLREKDRNISLTIYFSLRRKFL